LIGLASPQAEFFALVMKDMRRYIGVLTIMIVASLDVQRNCAQSGPEHEYCFRKLICRQSEKRIRGRNCHE